MNGKKLVTLHVVISLLFSFYSMLIIAEKNHQSGLKLEC